MTAASAIADMYGPRNRRTRLALANAFREIDVEVAALPKREDKPVPTDDPRVRFLRAIDRANEINGVTRKAAE